MVDWAPKSVIFKYPISGAGAGSWFLFSLRLHPSEVGVSEGKGSLSDTGHSPIAPSFEALTVTAPFLFRSLRLHHFCGQDIGLLS